VDDLTLENYITRYGWVYKRYDEALVAAVRSDAGDFPVAFQLTPPWLRLSAPILAPGRDRSIEYYTNLLELNERARLVRFAISEAGSVMLCLDLYSDPPPTFEQFRLALDVLTYYAETSLPHLQMETSDDEVGEEIET
jgi:hypothetical protein